MQGTAKAKDQLSGWSFGASGLLHVLACAIILLLPDQPQFTPPQEESVDVEIVFFPPQVEGKRKLPVDCPYPDRQAPPIPRRC